MGTQVFAQRYVPVPEELQPRLLLDVVKERKCQLTPSSSGVTERGRDEELTGTQSKLHFLIYHK